MILINQQTIPDSGKLSDIQLETSAAAIIVAIGGDAPLNVSNTKLSATLIKKTGGQEHLLPKMSLEDYATISSSQEGYMLESTEGVYTDRSFELVFRVDLSETGALSFNSDTYLSVNLEGLPRGQAENISVYALDMPINSKEAMNYDITNIAAGTAPKDLDMIGVNSVFLNYKNLDNITLNYSNGKSVVYTAAEIHALQTLTDDVTKVTDKVPTVGSDAYSIDVENVISMRYEPMPAAGAHNIVLIKTLTL